jgi:hypothetical protein
MTAAVLINLVTSWTMFGVIWMVQLVHYPLMAHTGPQHSAAYQRLHVRRMALLVIPIMLIEAAVTTYLSIASPSMTSIASSILLAGIWTITFSMSVPAHERLETGFTETAHKSLMASNRLRSILWSAKALVAVYMVTA